MTVGSTHSDYDSNAAAWSRARDVLSGEDAVKAAGEKYLPRLDSQSEEEYAAYKARASFFGATARTLEEYLDLIFRRAPLTSLPSSDAMRSFASDCDRWGTSVAQCARRIVSEVLSVGRAGSLVLWDEAARRPWVSSWRAEEILNWSVDWIGQRVVLVGVVLKDASRLRQLRLEGAECVHETFVQVDGAWTLEESVAL